MGMRTVRHIVAIAALVAATTSCGDVIRQGRSPVYLVMALLQAAQGNHISSFGGSLTSDVLTVVTQPAPCSQTSPCLTVFNDVGQAGLKISLKDIGTPGSPTTPSTNNEVTIRRYHVAYRRADGRNIPGVDVPYAFDGAATGTITGLNTLTLSFEIVRHVAKEESPLVQLVNSKTIITTTCKVTFYGRDQVGNELSVDGFITIDFGNFGDT